ncbi:MAG TPA: long-chain fatty acid--CoA ligase [Solirubrobacteraceae bacterium]|nr:long-chain fatty acid--CoA ligase [Solirubrobacteraceae bacterium]
MTRPHVAARGAPEGSWGELTIGHWIRDRAIVTPGRVAIEYGDERITYAELDARSTALAGALLDLGLSRGDRVASLTHNSPEHVELFFACAKAGLVLTPLSWRSAAAELAHQVADAEPAALFVEPQTESLAGAALAQAECEPLRLGLARAELDPLETDEATDEVEASVDDDDDLLLLYTSGTTGRPKGARLTHRNCFWTNLSLDRSSEMSGADVVLQVLPQFHVGGWNVQPLLAWWKGATVVLEPSFHPGRVLELIERRRITTMMGVPANYLFMAGDPRFGDADLSSLRQAIVGGAPMPEALLHTWHERGVAIVQGYGLTEASPNVLCLPAEEAAARLGWAGKPYPHVEAGLADACSEDLIAGPGTGELLVRGPGVFAGYWRDEAATDAALRNGWLHTGDVAERDAEGFYRIRDRLKDMYISGGENVYPAEVEAVLHQHPAIADAAVLAIPDEDWGEVGMAIVVLRGGRSADEAELLAFCRERLAAFKAPRAVRFAAELPRSPAGKLLKRELRERFERGRML